MIMIIRDTRKMVTKRINNGSCIQAETRNKQPAEKDNANQFQQRVY